MKNRSIYVAGLAWLAFIRSLFLSMALADWVHIYWSLLLLALLIFGFVLARRDKSAYPREARSARRCLLMLIFCWVFINFILPMLPLLANK
jgi:hypothetical protein